ncbi:MAG: hypothetical protein PHZ00_02275 [Candidatus Peribacteraceae bacterium]|nr:hypothetical protein [Candidatus Peribacteraceae bacterium]
MNIHFFLFGVSVAESRLLSQVETFSGMNDAIGASDDFEHDVVAKLDCKIRAKLDSMSDEDFEAALEAAKQAVLKEKDEELKTIQRRIDAADGALSSAASHARGAAVNINRRGHGVRQARRLRREYVPVRELATSQSIHQMHIQNESNGRVQIERMTSELGIKESIRRHLQSLPPPSRERVKELLDKMKVDAEKLREAKDLEISKRLDKMKLKDEVRNLVDVLPTNIRSAVADSFTSEFKLLGGDGGLAKIAMTDGALPALRTAIDSGKRVIDTANDTVDTIVNEFLAKMSPLEEEQIKKFFDALDNQTAAALANPEAFGVSPEDQEAFIADRIGLIKQILEPYKGTPTKMPPPASVEEGKFFVQKGLLMMSGVDVAALEKGKWDTQPVPMLKEDSPEATMAKFGGLILFCIGTAQMMKQSLKDLTNSKEKTPESFTGDNEKLAGELAAAEVKKNTDFPPPDPKKRLDDRLVAKREELKDEKDADRIKCEKEVKEITEKIAELEALQKKIDDLTAERKKRTDAVTDANTWINKKSGIMLEKVDLLAPCNLTFPEDSFAHPWGASGITKTFEAKHPVTFSESENVIQIGETTIRVAPAPVGEDIILTTGGKVETVYARNPAITDIPTYETARTTDNKAFMRSPPVVRNDPKVFQNEIGLDPSRLPYSPEACKKKGDVIAALAKNGATESPSFVDGVVASDPNFKSSLDDTKERLSKYQAVFSQLRDLTGGKFEVCMWSGTGLWAAEMDSLKTALTTLASKTKAVAWLKEGNNALELAEKSIAAPPHKDYARSNEILWISLPSIPKLVAKIDEIIRAHP